MVTHSVSFYDSAGTLLGSASSLPANVTVNRMRTICLSCSVHLFSKRDGLCKSDRNFRWGKHELHFPTCAGCIHMIIFQSLFTLSLNYDSFEIPAPHSQRFEDPLESSRIVTRFLVKTMKNELLEQA